MKDSEISKESPQLNKQGAEFFEKTQAKNIEISGTFSLGISDMQTEVLLQRAGLNGTTEKLVAKVRESLLDVFNSPPNIDELKDLVDLLPKDSEALDKILSLFAIHGFRGLDDHIKLLTSLDLSSLIPEKRMDLHDCVYEILRRRKEYSLALEQLDYALPIASQIGDPQSVLKKMTARGWCLAKLGHPAAENYHREIVTFASAHKLEEQLTDAYRTWSSFLWDKGRYQEALFLLERAVDLRKNQEPDRYLRDIYWLAQKYENSDRKKAVEKCLEAANLIGTIGRDLSETLQAEAHYATACILFRNTEDYESIVKHARIAFTLFDQWVGYEIRTAWCAKLLASSYDELGDLTSSASFEAEYQGRLKQSCDEKGTFALLAEPILKGTAKPDDLQHLEALVTEANDRQLTLRWNILFALHCHMTDRSADGLAICSYALSSVDENEYRAQYGVADLAHLYRAMAQCQLTLRMIPSYVYSMKKALDFIPADHQCRWMLCNNAFVLGDLQTALEQALWLQKHAPYVGAYRVHARVLLDAGDIEGAISMVSLAQAKYPSHPQLAEEYRELSEIKLGLLSPIQSILFKPRTLAQNSILLPASEASSQMVGLPEFTKLNEFKKSIIQMVVTYTHDIQKTNPGFVSRFKNATANLEEGDFRDDVERICGQKWREIGAETRHGAGRTDFLIRQPYPSLDAIVIEFKVWGRNDYKEVVSQLIGYLTDFQATGIVFMINANKAPIARKYLGNIILAHPSYITGSFRDKPLLQGRLDHFYSRHRSQMEKELSIFHFVLNIWEGPPII